MGRRDRAVELGRLFDPLLQDHLREEPVVEMVVVARLVLEVVDAVEGDRGHDGCVGVLEAGLKRGVVRGERGKRRQVPAGRAARDRDPLRIHAQLVGVLAHPGDRALDVDHVLGQRRARAQPVVRVEADPAVRRHVVEQGDALLGARAEDPAAAVDLDHRGQALALRHALAGAVDVEANAPLLLRVEDDVPLDLDVASPEHEERETKGGSSGNATRADLPGSPHAARPRSRGSSSPRARRSGSRRG